VTDDDAVAPAGSSPDEKIIREAHKRFNRVEMWESVARKRWLEDVKFANADADNMYQWPSITTQARGYGTADERPCLTINKTRQYCLQIINDSRQNKTAIKIKPTGGGATVEAAQVLEGWSGTSSTSPTPRAPTEPPPATRFKAASATGAWSPTMPATTPSTRKSSSAASRTR
jgi:hypothetical protein